jgi:hypothetical protein
MLTLAGLLVVAGFVFWLWAVFDAVTADGSRIRYLPKLVWLLVIVVFAEIGAAAWLLLGRPRNVAAAGAGYGTGPQQVPDAKLGGFGQRGFGAPGRVPPTTASRPIGPDDDPEFLKGL